MSIKLAKANAIIRGAFKKAAELNAKPLTVVVLDAGGHVIALQRADGCSFLRPHVAGGKAYGALGLGVGSASVENIFKDRPHFGGGLNAVSPQGIIPVAGGVLIRDKRGELKGAVGISGDTSDNDMACAISGIEASGFVADPG